MSHHNSNKIARFGRAIATISALSLSIGVLAPSSAFAEESEISPAASFALASGETASVDPATLSNAELIQQRRMLYRTHVDSAHIAWDAEKNNFKIQVVDGSTPKEANTVVVRLGPDATADGREVSRIKLPSTNKLSFLGEPGTVLWNAPAKFYNGWLPVWAGLGAGHDIPEHINGEALKLELVGVDGPGWATIWNGDTTQGGAATLSSKDPSLYHIIPEGGHGHFNWTFEKPGRYTFSFRASAKTNSGETITSEPYDVIWLVGSDEELGLPAGSTPGNPITTPAENFGTEENTNPDEGTSGEGGSESAPAPEDEDVVLPPFEGEYTCAAPGHYDLAVNIDAERRVSAAVRDDAENTYGSYELVVPVPDSALRTLEINSYTRALSPLGASGTKIWVLPEVQAAHLPWLGFNTETVDYSDINPDKGVRLYMGSFYGPGRMLTFDDDGINPIETVLDSRQVEYSYAFFEPTHRHTSMAFNKPGLYELGFQYKAFFQPAEGKLDQDYAYNEVYYAVGNEEVDKLCPTWRNQYDVAAPEGSSAGESNSAPGEEVTTPDEGDPGAEGEGTADADSASPATGEVSEENENSASASASASENVTLPSLPGSPAPAESHTTAPVCEPVTISRPATDEEWRAMNTGKSTGARNVARATVTFNVGPSANGNANNGHFDLGPSVEGGKLFLKVKDDRHQPAVWVSPSTLNFALGNAAQVSAPELLSSIATPGQPIWLISSVQKQGVPWLGMNSQHPGLNGTTTGPVTFTLESLRGPGKFLMFESGSFGGGIGRKLFTGSGSSFTLPANTHAHYNWVFTQPGTYTMTISARVTPSAGSPLAASNEVNLTGSRPMINEVVGRTADGSECDLPAEAKEGYARAAGINLPNTGAQSQALAGFALLSLLAGSSLAFGARRRARSK